MFDKDITVFNKQYDKETRTDKYVRTVLNGVHVEKVQSVNSKDTELVATDSLFVCIPYLEATINDGDIIVQGIVDDIDSVKELDEYYTVKSVEIFDYSKCLNHIEVNAS